jgi:hypothetical protein
MMSEPISSLTKTRGVLRVALLAFVTGCATVTPHENFKNNLRLRIGWSIDAQFYDLQREHLLSTMTLANGHLEYRYRQANDCVEIYEVDPKTRLIVRTDFEGSDKSCIIQP